MTLSFLPPSLGADAVDYLTAWDHQREIHAQVVAGELPDSVWLLEHPPVFTAGKRTAPGDRPADPGGAPVIDVDRGGMITFHGPGQLVGYPIVRLPDHVKVVDYVRRVEEALIGVCADLGLETARVPGRSGVWLRADERGPERKIAALGIRVGQGVTMHGFALNCDVDLSWYDRFVPCGISDAGVTSLSTELGRDVTENRTLLGIAGTSPFKWNGMNPNLETQDGPRTSKYIFRSQGFSAAEAEELASYIRSLRLPPNPRAPRGGKVTASEERGRAIFFRTKTNYGTIIPDHDRCYYCHAPLTHYTSRVSMDVGTATAYDRVKDFDVPQLEGVYMRAPYLHNGEALTLEEIWTKFNPKDQHGITSDMDKEQLNDLIDFLKTL